ncbi:MAG TPA: hypothetical protein VE008_11585 [Burkholderiales bacterium]|nr:hypothetical protein [Burkholderiales bacterium]
MQPVERELAGGYLSRVLASGARPFQFRATARTLLTGVGVEGQLDHAHAPPPVGFTYADLPVPVDPTAGLGRASFDAGGALAAKTGPTRSAPPELPDEKPKNSVPGSSAAPRELSDPPLAAPAPFSTRPPVDAGRPAPSGVVPGSKSSLAREHPAAPSTTTLEVPGVACRSPATARDLAGARDVGTRPEFRRRHDSAAASRIGSPSRTASENAQAKDTGPHQETPPLRDPERAPRAGAPSRSAPLSTQADDAMRQPTRAPSPARHATEDARNETTDLAPRKPVPRRAAPAVRGSSLTAEHVGIGAAVAPPLRFTARPPPFPPENSGNQRAAQNIEVLRGSVQALATKAVAAKAAPVEPTPPSPGRAAVKPAREVVVVRESAGRQSHRSAFWERRHLALPLLRVLR